VPLLLYDAIAQDPVLHNIIMNPEKTIKAKPILPKS
jgi:hypothetical protein